MNWIEQEIKTKAAIDSGFDMLWHQFAHTIRDVTDSYNTHYAQHGEVQLEPGGKSLLLKRKALDPPGDGLRDVAIKLAISKSQPPLFLASGPDSHESVIKIAVAADGRLYPVNDHGQEITLDEASRVLIHKFLFGPAYSKKRQ